MRNRLSMRIRIAAALTWALGCLGAGQALGQESVDPALLVEEFAATGKGPAPRLALGACPNESPWHAEVLAGLMGLPLTDARIEALAVRWLAVKGECQQAALLPWFEQALDAVREPEAARLVGEAVGRMTSEGSLAVLRRAALDPVDRPPEVQAQLQLAAYAHTPQQERVGFFTEALRVGTLTEDLSRRAVPFLIAGEHRNEFAIAVARAAASNPRAPRAEYVLTSVLHAASNEGDGGPGGLTMDTRTEVVRVLRDSATLERMDEGPSERLRTLADRVRVRGGGG